MCYPVLVFSSPLVGSLTFGCSRNISMKSFHDLTSINEIKPMLYVRSSVASCDVTESACTEKHEYVSGHVCTQISSHGSLTVICMYRM